MDQLKGSIITGSHADGGAITFLEHPYTLWDCNFGDPRCLESNLQPPPKKKTDGKLVGNWTFPFSIPFPTQVDLSTLRAVYARDSDGPIRFLPELLPQEVPVTPFDLGGYPRRSSYAAPRSSTHISPFDTRSPFTPLEKGELRFPPSSSSPERSTPHFAPISPNSSPTSVQTAPLVEPFTFDALETSSAQSSNDRPSKMGPITRSELMPRSHHRFRSASSMRDPDNPTSTSIYALPQSFLEHNVMANIHYVLILTITHGRFSTRSRLVQPFSSSPTQLKPIQGQHYCGLFSCHSTPGPDIATPNIS